MGKRGNLRATKRKHDNDKDIHSQYEAGQQYAHLVPYTIHQDMRQRVLAKGNTEPASLASQVRIVKDSQKFSLGHEHSQTGGDSHKTVDIF